MSGFPSEWRQGSILKFEGREWVILTQCCDIHHRTLENEPTIELIELTREPEPPSKVYYQGKHVRTVHLSDGENARIVVSSKSRRIFVEKTKLKEQSSYLERLAPVPLKNLRFWIGRRYLRVAFADNFNARFSSVGNSIAKRLKSIDPDQIEALYFVEDNEGELVIEKPDGDDYEVQLWFVLSADVTEEIKRDIEGFATEIDELAKENGIALDSRVHNITAVGLQEISNAISWTEHDWLSNSERVD